MDPSRRTGVITVVILVAVVALLPAHAQTVEVPVRTQAESAGSGLGVYGAGSGLGVYGAGSGVGVYGAGSGIGVYGAGSGLGVYGAGSGIGAPGVEGNLLLLPPETTLPGGTQDVGGSLQLLPPQTTLPSSPDPAVTLEQQWQQMERELEWGSLD
jgi:hypothetical protein